MSNIIPENYANFWGKASWGICPNGQDCTSHKYPVVWKGKTNVMELNRNPAFIAHMMKQGWKGLWELNTYPTIPVKVGDKVSFSADIWTEPTSILYPVWQSPFYGGGGAFLFLDIWGANGRIRELMSYEGRKFLAWGSGKWVNLKMEFIVQPKYESDAFNYVDGSGGVMIEPTGIMPILAGAHTSRYDETAKIYVANTELYINDIPVNTHFSFWDLNPKRVKPLENFTVDGFLFREGKYENLPDSEIVDGEIVNIQYKPENHWINYSTVSTVFDIERGYHGHVLADLSFISQVSEGTYPIRLYYMGNKSKNLAESWSNSINITVYRDPPPEPPPNGNGNGETPETPKPGFYDYTRFHKMIFKNRSTLSEIGFKVRNRFVSTKIHDILHPLI